jgi:TM2 domain-containing membrane protein YozV
VERRQSSIDRSQICLRTAAQLTEQVQLTVKKVQRKPLQCCGGAIRSQRQGVVSQPIALENEGIVTTPPPPPAPGWYPDPSGAAGQRYFDRVRWTDSRAPAHVPAPLAPKSAVAAGLLQLFLGWFGAGRWYIGTTNIAVCQLVLGLVGIFLTMFCFIGALILVPLTVWTVVEAFMMFAGRNH